MSESIESPDSHQKYKGSKKLLNEVSRKLPDFEVWKFKFNIIWEGNKGILVILAKIRVFYQRTFSPKYRDETHSVKGTFR